MNEFDKIERVLKEMENDERILQETKNIDAEINRLIDRRIRKICLKTVLVVTAVFLCFFLVVNPLVKSIYINPVKMEGDDSTYTGGFTKYLRTYYETMFPYVELVDTSISDEGFGEYDVILGINHHLEARRLYSNINGTVTLNIKQNKAAYEADPFGILCYMMGRFENEFSTVDKAVEQLSKLPEGTFVAASLSAEEMRPITEVMKDPITLEWVEVYTEGSDFLGGMNMNLSIRTREDEVRENGEQGLCRTYKENLDLLLSEPEFLNALGVYSSNGIVFMTLDEIKKTRDIVAEETQLKTKNYCVSGTKEELLEYLEKVEMNSVMIDRR